MLNYTLVIHQKENGTVFDYLIKMGKNQVKMIEAKEENINGCSA